MGIRKEIQVIKKNENVTIWGAQEGKKRYPIHLADLWHSVAFLWPKMKQYYFLNTFAASYLNTQGLNNSCLKSPASNLVDLTFQSRALRSFSLNQLRNLSL